MSGDAQREIDSRVRRNDSVAEFFDTLTELVRESIKLMKQEAEKRR